MIRNDLDNGPNCTEQHYFRPQDVIAVCRHWGKCRPQARHFVLYRDPDQPFGCGQMLLDVPSFAQAVKVVTGWGVPLLPVVCKGSQISHSKVNPYQISGFDRQALEGFSMHVSGVRYRNVFHVIGKGSVEKFLLTLPDGLGAHFIELVDEPPEWSWFRYWFDVTKITKVKLVPTMGEPPDEPWSVHVRVGDNWVHLHTTDVDSVIARIEAVTG